MDTSEGIPKRRALGKAVVRPASASARSSRAVVRAGATRLLVVGASVIALGCGVGGSGDPAVGETTQASVRIPQTPLNGNDVPKFVDALPTFNGRRADGSATLNVSMQEFQQQVLPSSVYDELPAPFNAGTFLWGYNINNAGPSWPARTIEARQGTSSADSKEESAGRALKRVRRQMPERRLACAPSGRGD